MNIKKKIEALLLSEFKTVPFHNIFMLNNKKNMDAELGGTCSDKVLHFKKILLENGFDSVLHSSFINGYECHRMLKVLIDKKIYFIDVGSGWPTLKLIPAYREIEYSIFGMSFKTEYLDHNLLVFHRTGQNFKLMLTIPLESKPENEIYKDIEVRFDKKDIYPFHYHLRFSQIIGDSFYFIKADELRIYNELGIEKKSLNKNEIEALIQDTFRFKLEGFEAWYTPKK